MNKDHKNINDMLDLNIKSDLKSIGAVVIIMALVFVVILLVYQI